MGIVTKTVKTHPICCILAPVFFSFSSSISPPGTPASRDNVFRTIEGLIYYPNHVTSNPSLSFAITLSSDENLTFIQEPSGFVQTYSNVPVSDSSSKLPSSPVSSQTSEYDMGFLILLYSSHVTIRVVTSIIGTSHSFINRVKNLITNDSAKSPVVGLSSA